MKTVIATPSFGTDDTLSFAEVTPQVGEVQAFHVLPENLVRPLVEFPGQVFGEQASKRRTSWADAEEVIDIRDI